jgi:hypothetical protein
MKLQLTKYISENASRLSKEVTRFSSKSNVFGGGHNILYPDPILSQLNWMFVSYPA